MLTSEAMLTPNCLVCVERSGQIDFVGLMQTHPFNEGIRARIYNIERLLRAVMERERQTGSKKQKGRGPFFRSYSKINSGNPANQEIPKSLNPKI